MVRASCSPTSSCMPSRSTTRTRLRRSSRSASPGWGPFTACVEAPGPSPRPRPFEPPCLPLVPARVLDLRPAHAAAVTVRRLAVLEDGPSSVPSSISRARGGDGSTSGESSTGGSNGAARSSSRSRRPRHGSEHRSTPARTGRSNTTNRRASPCRRDPRRARRDRGDRARAGLPQHPRWPGSMDIPPVGRLGFS
jgi:hypothetical protein